MRTTLKFLLNILFTITLLACQSHQLSQTDQRAEINQNVLNIRYQEILKAIQHFQNSLNLQQQKSLIQPFDHPHRTRGFCYVLAHCKTEYVGLRMRDLNAGQKYALNELLMKALSGEGYSRAVHTMNREWLLEEMENAHRVDPKNHPVIGSPEVPNWQPPLQRGAADYYIAIFGEPDFIQSKSTVWGLRFEGHHLTLNLTFGEKNGQTSIGVTPIFFGASPMAIPKAPMSKKEYPHWHAQESQQTLQRESWLARSFLKTLTQQQRQRSQWNALPTAELMGGTAVPLDANVFLQNQRPGQKIQDLSKTQQALLWDFIEAFALIQNTHAVPWEELKNQIEHSRVWWFGDIQDEHAELYIRVQSPRYLVELLQANTFGVVSDVKANHVHASFRDLKSDWDFNPLSEHLKIHHAD
ncbi:MAG: DUF3500 domain-containing protein [Pseudomonadota bacterium]